MTYNKFKSQNLEKCSLCNYCRAGCPIYIGSEKEIDSPRSKTIKIKTATEDGDFYRCSLCGFCKTSCPNDVDIEAVKVRNNLVKEGVETESNKKMIENVRKHGNPFGEPGDHSDDDEFYCC